MLTHYLSLRERCSELSTRTLAHWALLLALLFTSAIADALTVTAVQSRKIHGTAGPFDLTIDTAQSIGGNVTVEPRAIGAGHQIVFQFDAPIIPGSIGVPSAIDEAGAAVGTLTTSASGNEAVVTVADVPDNKRVTVMLTNVNGVGVDVVASLGFLLGDVTNSRAVAPDDLQQLKSRSGQVVDSTNYQFDINATGWITAADIVAVKARGNRSLPATQMTYALTLSKTGTGAGNVTSAPLGINCGATCTANYSSGSVVVLSASASGGSIFGGWGGACTGTGTCSVTMSAARSVSATFTLAGIVIPPDPATVAPPLDIQRSRAMCSAPLHFSTVAPIRSRPA